MIQIRKILFVMWNVLAVMLLSAAFNETLALNVIQDVRSGQQMNGLRIVIEGTEKFNYDAFLLDNPNRLVVDIKNARVQGKLSVRTNSILRNFRIGELAKANGKRLVFELKNNVNIRKKFVLEPQKGQSNWRLVVDLMQHGSNSVYQNDKNSGSGHSVVRRKKIVVIDPGHGGKDPGAIGRSYKTYEKNVTLAMGKELRRALENQGFKVYMTRSTDVFIPLRKRVAIARAHHADLFISLHADSAANRKARGLSIYTLSERASDREAEALAERENKADIIDGMDFSDNSPEINDVLISLSQNDSRNKSSKFASYVVAEMKRQVKLINDTHKFAGFAVLKAPDIPSVLIELGYLSNYSEEKFLRQQSYRRKLSEAIARSVVKYFKDPEIKSSI